MVSARGILIGGCIILLGFFTIYTFISPDFLFSIGMDIKTYNTIMAQWNIWGIVIGIAIVIAGLISMERFN